MKVMRNGRAVTVDVTADGSGLVSRAGTALLARVAEPRTCSNARAPGGRGRGNVRLSSDSSACRQAKIELGRFTLKVMRDGRPVTVEVTSDGEGLVSHAGTALLAQVADKLGLTRTLSLRLAVLKQRRRGHDPGRVIRDLAVTLADGGECVSDLGAVRDQEALFGPVASDSTAFRVIDRIASEPGLLEALRAAHARARERFWKLAGAPERLTIDLDATLITAHSEKEQAAGNYKGGFGFFPLMAYADQTHEGLAAMLRPGNAGANTAAITRRCSTARSRRSRPSTLRASRSWCARTPPARRTSWPTTVIRRACASRSAMT